MWEMVQEINGWAAFPLLAWLVADLTVFLRWRLSGRWTARQYAGQAAALFAVLLASDVLHIAYESGWVRVLNMVVGVVWAAELVIYTAVLLGYQRAEKILRD